MNALAIESMHDRARVAAAEAYEASVTEYVTAYDATAREIEVARYEEAKAEIEAQEKLSERLSEARTPLDRALIQAGVSHQELATELGVSRPPVSCWASGKEGLPIDRIEEIAAFLGADIRDLHGQSPDSFDNTGQPLNASPFGWAFVVSGRTNSEAARVCGVSTQVIERWKFGKHFPTQDQAAKFVRAFLPGIADTYGVGHG